MKQYLDIDELASRLRMSKSTIYGMTSKRLLPFLSVGRRVLFDPEQIERWLADRQVGAA